MTIQRIAHPHTRGEYAASAAVHGAATLCILYLVRKISEGTLATYLAGLTPIMTSLAVRKLTDKPQKPSSDDTLLDTVNGLNEALKGQCRELARKNCELTGDVEDLKAQLLRSGELNAETEEKVIRLLGQFKELRLQPIDVALLAQLVNERAGQGQILLGNLPKLVTAYNQKN